MAGNIRLEVCTGSIRSVVTAVQEGAGRIELCSALPLDGLTPSAGLIRCVREAFPSLEIRVLIRPREGGFVYSKEEALMMERDILAAQDCGADAVVTGALTPSGEIDKALMERLIARCRVPVTFHRAFDRCVRPLEALEDLISLGCQSVLTSGTAPTAAEGIPMLRALVEKADGRIGIMPGGGIDASNVVEIVRGTGVSIIHASASAPGPDGVKDTDPQCLRALQAALLLV